MAQQAVRVTAKRIERPRDSGEGAGPDGWIISDFTIGYSSTEIEIGKPFTAMFGYTNLTSAKVELRFETKQRILVQIHDSKGKLIYETKKDTVAAPGAEGVEPMAGTFWQEQITLDKRFAEGEVYLITGYLRAVNFPAVGSVILVVPKSKK